MGSTTTAFRGYRVGETVRLALDLSADLGSATVASVVSIEGADAAGTPLPVRETARDVVDGTEVHFWLDDLPRPSAADANNQFTAALTVTTTEGETLSYPFAVGVSPPR